MAEQQQTIAGLRPPTPGPLTPDTSASDGHTTRQHKLDVGRRRPTRAYEVPSSSVAQLATTLPILEGPKDFESWYNKLKSVLLMEDTWDIVSGESPRPIQAEDATPDELRDFADDLDVWMRKNRMLCGLVTYAVKPGVHVHIKDFTKASDMMSKLQELFSTKGYNIRGTLFNELLRTTPTSKGVAVYAESMKRTFGKLAEIGHKLPNWVLTHLFLLNVGDKYKDYVQMLQNSQPRDARGIPLELDLDLIIEQLIERERDLKGNGNKAFKTSERSDSQNRKGEGIQCHYCSWKGHRETNCFFKHPEKAPEGFVAKHKDYMEELKKKKKKNKASSSKANKTEELPEDKVESVGKVVAYHTRNNLASTSTSAWYLDSAASIHLTCDDGSYIDSKRIQKPISLADGKPIMAERIGTVRLRVIVNDEARLVDIPNVHYAPALDSNLLSVGTIESKGYKVDIRDGRVRVSQRGRTVLEGSRDGTLYTLDQADEPGTACAVGTAMAVKPADIGLWHRRLGHLNWGDVKRLESLVNGIALKGSSEQNDFCEPCVYGKQHRTPSRVPMQRATAKFERIHTDLGGGGKTLNAETPGYVEGFADTPSIGNNHYYIVFTDDYTRFRWWYPLKSKSEAFGKLLELLAMIKNQEGLTLKKLRSDNGGEFDSKAVKLFLQQQGIQWEPTVPYAPDQNGVSERSNRTLIEKARTQLIGAGLPPKLWGEALNNAVYLTNRSPSRSTDKTPYEEWYGNKPDLSHLRVFGCAAYALDPHAKSRGKMAPRSHKTNLVGYEAKNQYRLYDPDKDSIIRLRDVVFNEAVGANKAPEEKGEGEKEDGGVDDDPLPVSLPSTIPMPPPTPPTLSLSTPSIEGPLPVPSAKTSGQPLTPEIRMTTPEASPTLQATGEETLEALEVAGQEAEEAPANNDVQEVERLKSQPLDPTPARVVDTPTTTSTRKSNRLADKQKIDYKGIEKRGFAKAVLLLPPSEPKTHRQAKESPESKQWDTAMDDEYISLLKNETWDLVNPPHDRKVLQGRWVYKWKLGQDGKVIRHKARWVVKGYEQTEGIDYFETFASVVKSTTVRLLLAVAAEKDWEIEQMDVKTAFLYGDLEEEVYVKQPTGYGADGKVCRLRKALYGLKQSPRVWYQTLTSHLVNLGFSKSNCDDGLFYNRKTGIYLPIYVDDLLLIGPDMGHINALKKQLASRYEMSDLGPCRHYLGVQITRDRKRRTLTLTQSGYINQVLKQHQMEDCKSVTTPMESGATYGPTDKAHVAFREDITAYKSAIGSLLYLTTQTRPDIAFSVSKLAQFGLNPTPQHWSGVKRVMRYLKGTKDVGITYNGVDSAGLVGYTDSDWAGDKETRRSTSGFVYTMNGGAISWKSKRQPCVALSSCEAEYIASAIAGQEAAWLQRLVEELGYPLATLTLWADNQGAIAVANNMGQPARMKHIDLRYHYIRELVESGVVHLDYTPTTEMTADGLTKALDTTKFERFLRLIGLRI